MSERAYTRMVIAFALVIAAGFAGLVFLIVHVHQQDVHQQDQDHHLAVFNRRLIQDERRARVRERDAFERALAHATTRQRRRVLRRLLEAASPADLRRLGLAPTRSDARVVPAPRSSAPRRGRPPRRPPHRPQPAPSQPPPSNPTPPSKPSPPPLIPGLPIPLPTLPAPPPNPPVPPVPPLVRLALLD